MKAVLLVVAVLVGVVLCSARSFNDTDSLSFKAGYTGAKLSDAFSSIFYAGDGIVLAGKRSNTAGNRIFRSTDHGRSWQTTPEPSGYSGKHVYFFGMNNETKVLVTGTGDTGKPCLLRSTDMGQTWTVVLSAEESQALAGCDAGALFSPLNVHDKTWIACLRNTAQGKSHIIESNDDGLNWHSIAATGLTAGCRKMIMTSHGHILCAGVFADSGTNPGLFISADHGHKWKKVINNILSFAGMAELPKSVYLAGTMCINNAPNAISTAKRSGNRVTVTTKQDLTIADGTCVGIASMKDPSMNVHPCTSIKVTGSRSFYYHNVGPDVAETSQSNAVFLPPCPCDIYRSSDIGASWEKVGTLAAYSHMTYIRDVRYLGNGLVYAFVAADENAWDNRGLVVYRSTDYGQNWERVKEEIYVGQYGRLNSVYQTALTDKNILVAATQPDSDIIYQEGPFN